jgi:hypothetical protein
MNPPGVKREDYKRGKARKPWGESRIRMRIRMRMR